MVVVLVSLSLAVHPIYAQEKLSEKDVRKLMEEAEKKVNDGKPAEAIEAYRSIVKDYPENGEVQLKLAELYRANEQWASASTAYQRASDNLTGPDQGKAFEGLTMALTKEAKYEQAVEAGQKALAANPSSASALVNLAFSLSKTGKLQEAADTARKALELEPNSPSANATLGEALLADGKFDEAEASFGKALAIDSKNAEALAGMADIYLRKEQYDQAIESATQALELNDKLTRAYAIRGMAQNAKGETGAAYSDLSMAVTVNPNDPDAQFAFAQVYEKQGNFGMAAAAYSKALTINPSLSEAYAPLVNILIDQGRYSQAIEHLKQGTERMPDNADFHYLLGQCYYMENQPDAALDAYTKALAIDGEMSKALAGKGKVLLDKQDVATAMPLLQKAAELEPENADILTDYGGALVANQQIDEALPYLTKAAASPGYANPGGLYNLGFALLSKKEYADAIGAFERSIAALPNWAAPYVGLGWAVFGDIPAGCPCTDEDNAKVQKLTEAYNKAVELGTDDPGLKERVDALAKGEKVK
jgi:tetratricopeptide (TPR) repeat protein